MKKSKWLFRLLSLALCSVFAFSFVACNNSNNSSSSSTGGNEPSENVKETFTETQYDLVKNAQSDYKIVIPEEPTENMQIASTDFQGLFEEATGAKLAIVADTAITYSDDAKIISIGDTACCEEVGLSATYYELGDSGYRIKTVGQNLFLYGASDYGDIFSLYGLLKREFGFVCYSSTGYYIEEGCTDVKLKDYDVEDVPDFSIQSSGYGSIKLDPLTSLRMGYVARAEGSAFSGPLSVHNTCTYYLNTGEYYDPNKPEQYHPKWYLEGGSQLCYTAHGDEAEYELMQETVLSIMKRDWIKNFGTTARIILFSQEDFIVWCHCPACNTIIEKHGANSATQVLFVNELAEKFSAWMDSEEGAPYKKDFIIMFLAYHETTGAPVTYDSASDTYIPNGDEIILHPNVGVMFAPIFMNYHYSVYDKVNEDILTMAEGWLPLTENIGLFTYMTNFTNYCIYFDCLNSKQDLYKKVATNGKGLWLYDEGVSGFSGQTPAFEVLTAYISSRLGRDASLDVNELIEDYFDNYFGPASTTMKRYYNEYRIHFTYLADTHFKNLHSVIDEASIKTNYWSKSLLERWLGYIDEALAETEYLRAVNPRKYASYTEHIKTERLAVYFLMIDLYWSAYDKAYILEIIDEFEVDAKVAGLLKVTGDKTVEAYVAEMRAKIRN